MTNKITAVYTRHYRDSGQTTTYVKWDDGSRTEWPNICPHCGSEYAKHNSHVQALLARAKRDGIKHTFETW